MVTDIAYYKDAEDLQKRIAQVHSPGIRGNILATDYGETDASGKVIRGPQRVSDGKFRAIKVTDFDTYISNVIDNITEVFKRKIAAAPEHLKKSYGDLLDSLVREGDGAYRSINVADGQGFTSITGYRKRALMFGEWSKEAEELYKKIHSGNYTYDDLQIAFQPRKPFVYSQITKDTGVKNPEGQEGLLERVRVPIQYKNSEYLLIMADALLRGEETGKPNLLRALYDVMEASHYSIDPETGKESYKTDGIDVVQFTSVVKSGLMGDVNLNKLLEDPNGEAKARAILENAIYETIEETVTNINPETGEPETSTVYRRTGNYNKNSHVDEIPFEDYAIQQSIPEHFKNHEQLEGSQIRASIISELVDTIYEDGIGVPVTYKLDGKDVSAEEIKKEYEKLHAENIEEGIRLLEKELCLSPDYTIKERNIAVSKILQREILGSIQRYGIELLQACSVDKDGNFRIPPGDPIQSKRIEQLLNSVIKGYINKQKISGGPVVQVTNYGTSKQLNIRFKDKSGKLLDTKTEYSEKKKITDKELDKAYDQYIKENQGGIAYYEAYISIYDNELFKKFATSNDSSIDVDAIDLIAPDLLKLVGYRIPTEDKYSMMPIKIVGFLPKEAGDGIMLPYEITTISGADFDIDKLYILRKKLDIAHRVLPNVSESMSEAEQSYLKQNRPSVRKHIKQAIGDKINPTKAEIAEVTKQVKEKYDVERRRLKANHTEKLDKINEQFTQLEEANEKAQYSTKEEKDAKLRDKAEKKTDKNYDKTIDREVTRYEVALAKLEEREQGEIDREVENLKQNKVNNKIDDFLNIDRTLPARFDDSITREIRKAYLNYMYKIIEPGEGKYYRDNRIIDIMYEILTHETSAEKLLNPGNFESQKKVGYVIEAYKVAGDQYSYEELQNMSIKQLETIVKRSKNLSYVDTQVQFYEQNSSAGASLGIFAVARTAHAILESGSKDGSAVYRMDVYDACGINSPFTIAGMKFEQLMPFDMRYNNNGESIGKILGSMVGASADAAKDPILNLMNINNSTINILNTLIRFGMPFEHAALLLSQRVITDALNIYNRERITKNISPNRVIKDIIKKLKADHGITEQSQLNSEELTYEEMLEGLRTSNNPNIAYKALLAFTRVKTLSDALKMPTFATRFNSIANAAGPLIIDNLITEHKVEEYQGKSHIVGKDGTGVSFNDIIRSHPMLAQFARAFGEAKTLFGNMPANSTSFKSVLNSMDDRTSRIIYGDRNLLSKLSDFYQSYIAMVNNVVGPSELSYYIHDFPIEFMKEKYKEKYPKNLLIQSIKYNTDKGRIVLQINLTGENTAEKTKLSNAWADLHKVDPELSLKLFKYNFFRGGIGFNPKTFMSILPIQLREAIPNYISTYRVLPNIQFPARVVDQFIRNNWDNNSLVPIKSKLSTETQENGNIRITNKEQMRDLADVNYFKTKVNNGYKLFTKVNATEDFLEYQEILPLGDNKGYIEIADEYITTPVTITKDVVIDTEENAGEEVIDSQENTVDAMDEADSNEVSTNEELERQLVELFTIEGIRTEEKAKEKIEEFRKKGKEDRKSYETQMKKYFRTQFEKRGIPYEEELIDKLFNKLC